MSTDRLGCEARVAALDKVLAELPGPALLVAHSAGVITTVHWAQRHGRPIQGALLATPPDLDTALPEGHPTLDDLCSNPASGYGAWSRSSSGS